MSASGSAIQAARVPTEERALVQLDDALEVRRLWRKVAGQLAHEVLLAPEAEEPVEAALEADCRARLLAHPRAAAERPADVAGPSLREVVQLEQPVERSEELTRTLLGLDREVGTCDVADEERVAGDDQPGLFAARSVGDDVRRVLGPVARSGEGGDAHTADRDGVPVRHRLVVEGDLGGSRHVNGRAGRLLQSSLAGDVVGMVMGLEDVRDPEAVLVGKREVVLDVPLRVDDRRLAAVGDEVRRAPEILVQHLTEEHAGMIGGRLPRYCLSKRSPPPRLPARSGSASTPCGAGIGVGESKPSATRRTAGACPRPK